MKSAFPKSARLTGGESLESRLALSVSPLPVPNDASASLGVVNDRLLLTTDRFGLDHDVYSTDGSPDGTVVFDTNFSRTPTPIGQAGGRLYFSNFLSDADEREIWSTSGNDGDMRLELTIDRNQLRHVFFEDRLYLLSEVPGDSGNRTTVYVMDEDGPTEIASIEGRRGGLAVTSSHIFVVTTHDPVPYSMNMETSQIHAIDDQRNIQQVATVDSVLTDIVTLDDKAYFAFGREYFVGVGIIENWDGALWVSDGTPEQTTELATLGGMGFGPLQQTETEVYVVARQQHNRWLWHTDGTVEGTKLAFKVPSGNDVRAMRPLGSRLLLWHTPISSGTVSGSVPPQLLSVENGVAQELSVSANLDNSALYDGKYFFVVETEDFGRELWNTDGTPEGTSLFHDIHVGEASALKWNPSFATGADGLLYFVAEDGEYGFELWRTDATAGGTSMAFDTRPGSVDGAGEPPQATALGDKIVFRGQEDNSGTRWMAFADDWTNRDNRFDVDANSVINPQDVVLVVNELIRRSIEGSNGELRDAPDDDDHFVDIDGDNFVTPQDAIALVNEILRMQNGGSGRNALIAPSNHDLDKDRSSNTDVHFVDEFWVNLGEVPAPGNGSL